MEKEKKTIEALGEERNEKLGNSWVERHDNNGAYVVQEMNPIATDGRKCQTTISVWRKFNSPNSLFSAKIALHKAN